MLLPKASEVFNISYFYQGKVTKLYSTKMTNKPLTESEGLGTYIRGLDWECLASQILQVPSSDDLQSIRNITQN